MAMGTHCIELHFTQPENHSAAASGSLGLVDESTGSLGWPRCAMVIRATPMESFEGEIERITDPGTDETIRLAKFIVTSAAE